MNEQTIEILLTEIRGLREEVHDFRTEVNAWRQDAGERLATLEAHDHDISGNGQPGRMQKVEEMLVSVTKKIWLGWGIVTTLQAIVFALVEFWPWGHR